MRNVFFASTNKRKIDNYKRRLFDVGINMITIPIAVDELRDLDVRKVSFDKLNKIAKIVQYRPLFVEDRGLSIKQLNGFPGPYVKLMCNTFGLSKLFELLGSKIEVEFFYAIAYVDGDGNYSEFYSKEKGYLLNPNRSDKLDLWDVFVSEFSNGKTISSLGVSEFKRYELLWSKNDALTQLIRYLLLVR